MSSQPQRKTARISQNLQLNKKLHFPTAHSTGKYQKTSVIRTIENQIENLNSQVLVSGSQTKPHAASNINSNALITYEPSVQNSQERAQKFHINSQFSNSLENSQERRGPVAYLFKTEDANTLRGSNETLSKNPTLNTNFGSKIPNMDYNTSIQPTIRKEFSNGGSRGLRAGAVQGSQGIGNLVGAKNIQFNLKNHQEHLQQYQSIPVKTSKRDSSYNRGRQTQALMKMYQNSNNNNGGTIQQHRKYVKSVERKFPNERQQAIKISLQNQSLISQSNSKLSNSYQLNPIADYIRKSSGGTLNNSIISAINIYDSTHNLNTSSENIRFKTKRGLNGNGSQTKQYQQVSLQPQFERNLQNSQSKRVSSKNLKTRYQNQALLMKSVQPLEELRNAINYQTQMRNETQQKPNQLQQNNLFIQQNDAYQDSDLIQAPSSEKINKANIKYLTMSNISQSTIGSSTRKLPMKNFQHGDTQLQFHNQQNPNMTMTMDTAATTDHVMYLKQQELIAKSHSAFEEGKRNLLEKNYKEAIKSFSLSLKYCNANKDSKYYRAICYLDNENSKKCINDLNELIEIDPGYNQTVYIVLSIAYRRENDLNNSLKALTRGIQKFPKYVEAYQARGQIHIYLKKFDKALIDFQNVIKLQPMNGSGFIGQADSLKGIGNLKGALQSYNQAIQIDSTIRNQAITKRAVLLYQLKNYEQSLQDFQMLLDGNDLNPRAHFYKGKILNKQSQENEAVLHFEQVIKNSSETDDQLSGNALFEIAKIRIKQKDFYEAFHNLQRAVHYDFKSKKFMQYKMFVEGVLLIMKRKVKKGIKLLTQLVEGAITFDAKEALASSGPLTIGIQSKSNIIEKEQNKKVANSESNNQLKSQLVYLIYIYRSYGFIITELYDKALNDLNKAAKIKKLESACVYNKFIVQALIKIQKKDLNGVKSILNQAETKFPMNKDPYKFQAICIVQGVIQEMVDIDNPKKKQAMIEAQEIINRFLERNPKDTNMLYLRGLILYYMHQFYEALIDLDAVIDLDEDPQAKHYIARGRCHACLSMFQEAIADLTKAIEIDEELSDAYFNRGKCAYLLGDTALAFLDFQKLILLEPKNPMVHIYAGNLLMTTGSYDDATKAFTNADSVQKSALAFYQRSRCYIALANLDQALKDLNLVVERNPQDKIAYVDRECILSIKNAIVASQNNQSPLNSTFPNSPQTRQGYDPSVFEKSIVVFTKLLNTHYDIESNITQSISAIRNHQQIIPNVKRIKIEKMRALRRKRAKDEFQNGSGVSGMKRTRKVRQRFFLNDHTDQQLEKQAKVIEPFSYYKENIFGQEDFYLYRGIMNFYIGEYTKAIQDFEQSIKTKQDQKEDGNDGDNMSSSSNQTDLSDVGLCSLNIHESNFNITLCYIQLKEYNNAIEKLNTLISDAHKKYIKCLFLIRGLLHQLLGNQSKAKADFDNLAKSDQNLYQEFFVKKTAIQVNPFPLGTRLCQHFPEVKCFLSGASTSIPQYFCTRPSFSFPFVKPPNMIPNVDEIVLSQEFNLKIASPPKPEAPWIKRCDYGIKFTDEIQFEDNPSITETEQQSTQKDDDENQNRNDHRQHQDEGESDEESPFQVGKDNSRLRAKQQQPSNERYYLRAYVKEQKAKMLKSISEQVMKNEFNFFRELEEQQVQEELDEGTDEDDNPPEDTSSQGDYQDDDEDEPNIQDQLRQHLYGATDIQNDGIKNIIVDDEINEDMPVEESQNL